MLERLARRMARPHLDGELCDLDAAGLASFAQTRAAVDNQLATIFSGAAGVTGWAPPVDFGPGVTPAPFSVRVVRILWLPLSLLLTSPLVGPLPASAVAVVTLVGPLPAISFWPREGRDREPDSNHGEKPSTERLDPFAKPAGR